MSHPKLIYLLLKYYLLLLNTTLTTMKFLKSLLYITLLIAWLTCINCLGLKASNQNTVSQTQVDSLVAGIYTSIEQINNNEPLHLLQAELVQYNTADIFFVKKVKFKLLKDALAISNGKALYLNIGNYKGKKGFIKCSFENWFNTSNKKTTTNQQFSSNFTTGLYRNILNFNKPEIEATTLQFEKKGSKNIYALPSYSKQQLSNIIAAINGPDIYLVTGSYLNQIAFVKNQTKGPYFYFETPTSTLVEASSKTIFNSGVNNLNATALLQQPNLKTVGILYNVKTNQLSLLTNNATKNLLIMLPIIQAYPQILLQFISSAKQPEDCKLVLQRINAFYDVEIQ